MATTKAKKNTKSTSKAKVHPHSSVDVPSLVGLALLLGLLCVLPWLSQQDGSSSFRALQVSVALLLALGGGACLGVVWAGKKK